jgi:hypothetical protein
MADVYTVTHRQIPWTGSAAGGPLGRNVRHDSRSLAYRYQHDGRELAEVLHSRHIPILDQGDVGSCTGNAEVGALASDPLYGALPAAFAANQLNENEALRLYSAAEDIDGDGPYPPNDNGSSGLSVAQAAKNAGLISGYTHCLSLADFTTALQDGPVLLGCNWYDSMDKPDKGTGEVVISPGASVRGGHEIVARGVDPLAQTVFLDNSWGTGWGVGGSFILGWGTLERLLGEQGDGTVPLPLSAPAPTPVPIPPVPVPPGPVPASLADQALAAYAEGWIAHRHTGDNARMASKLRTWLAAKGF